MANFSAARSCGRTFNATSDCDCDCGCNASALGCGCAASTLGCGCGCGCGESCDCSAAVSAADSTAVSSCSNRDDNCTCCKQSLREALKLLCCNAVSDLVDFDAFAFLAGGNIVGATPGSMDEEDSDNLGELTGTFRRFSPCNCDLIDIEGTVLTPYGTTVEVDEASLCALDAIVFQLLAAPECSDCTNDTDLCRYRRVRDLFQRQLQSMSRACGECVSNCDCKDDCCCAEGILNALSNTSLNKRTTLVAGLLSVRDVTALGTIGSVLVLGSEDENRFYFVCANKVEFLA